MNFIKLIVTFVRIVLGAFGVIFTIDGMVTLYARYALEEPSRRFILHIMHDQQWTKLIIGLACVIASLIMITISDALKAKGGKTLPPGRTS